jgi:hypothetical protein
MAKRFKKSAEAPMMKGKPNPPSDLSPKGAAVGGTDTAKKSFTKSIKAEKRYQPKVVLKGG